MVTEVWGSQISWQLAHEGGKVVSHTYRPPLHSQEIFLVLIPVRGWVNPRAVVWPEGLCQWKFQWHLDQPMTFRLVMQCLNRLCHRMPHDTEVLRKYSVPLPLCPPRVQRGLTLEWNQAFVVRSCWLGSLQCGMVSNCLSHGVGHPDIDSLQIHCLGFEDLQVQ